MIGPCIFRETDHWALLVKPHGMPTAPLKPDEKGTLLSWFLTKSPESGKVIGRKPIEHGLVHRLDTDTYGFVLVAKTQKALEFFIDIQQNGNLVKTYRAFCAGVPVFDSSVHVGQLMNNTIPIAISSQFRAFGPGRKQVRPVFREDRHHDDNGTTYTTTILSLESTCTNNTECTEITCSLKAGFRHQVRVHLCALGYPIIGDPLYNESIHTPPMQLYADGIRFIDPESHAQEVFSLLQPDKMIR